MQFKTDENLSDQVAELLREAGWDSVTIHAEPLDGNLWILQETGLRIREGT
jgi:hypothetical protein